MTPKLERRWRMIRAYLEPGATAQDVADRFGITLGGLRVNMSRWGVKLPKDEFSRRITDANRRSAEQRTAPLRGRPRVWPDCPKHLLKDYETMRQYMPAIEAREILEGREISA